jgi:hypothetical protein
VQCRIPKNVILFTVCAEDDPLGSAGGSLEQGRGGCLEPGAVSGLATDCFSWCGKNNQTISSPEWRMIDILQRYSLPAPPVAQKPSGIFAASAEKKS